MMSKIEELIEKLCPEGVEYKDFNAVCRYIRGVTYSKTDEITNGNSGIFVLRANNITLESNTLNYEDVKVVAETVKVKNEQWLKKNDILIYLLAYLQILSYLCTLFCADYLLACVRAHQSDVRVPPKYVCWN